MRIWRLDRPVVSTFKEPELAARWMPVANENDTAERVGPLRVEWPSSRIRLVDFIWPGIQLDLVARADVAHEIVGRFAGAKLFDVECISRRSPKPADFWSLNPYKVIWIDKWVTADEARSSFRRSPRVPGKPNLIIEGIERYAFADDDDSSDAIPGATRLGPYIHIARVQQQGVFVDRSQLDVCNLFRIRQVPGLLLCTDVVAEFLSTSGYSNVELLDYGELF